MTVQDLIAELSTLPAELRVLVASTPANDQCPLELVVPHEHTDDDYVLVSGSGELGIAMTTYYARHAGEVCPR
jgi:hypothetical protein